MLARRIRGRWPKRTARPDATVESHEGPASIIRIAHRREAGDCQRTSRWCDSKQGRIRRRAGPASRLEVRAAAAPARRTRLRQRRPRHGSADARSPCTRCDQASHAPPKSWRDVRRRSLGRAESARARTTSATARARLPAAKPRPHAHVLAVDAAIAPPLPVHRRRHARIAVRWGSIFWRHLADAAAILLPLNELVAPLARCGSFREPGAADTGLNRCPSPGAKRIGPMPTSRERS